MAALTDTHCHLDFDAFAPDRQQVLERAWAAGVDRILIPGIDLASCQMALTLANQHAGVFAAVGVHPNSSLTWTESSPAEIRQLAKNPKVVAIGEIGLDYYRDRAPKVVQRKAFHEQLELAAELGLPVVIHNRLASADIVQMLAEWHQVLVSLGSPLATRPGVLHSYSDDVQTARLALELGFSIGITGPVTFRNAGDLQQVVAALPLDRILVETDAPFLAPHPLRGQRNEPAHVRLVAEKVAILQNMTGEAVANQTSENARKLFQWGVSH